MTNEEGRILEVNDAYVRCSGYRREELVGMHISALEAKEQPAETAAHILKIRQNGTDLFESLHRAKDGTVWPVEVNAAYWPSAGGRTMVFLRDITERKAGRGGAPATDRPAGPARQDCRGGARRDLTRFHLRPDGSSYLSYASPAIEDLFGLPRAVRQPRISLPASPTSIPTTCRM